MHIHLVGKLTENVGNIGIFKHTFNVDYSADVPHTDNIFSVPIGPAKLQGGISVLPETANPTFDDIMVHLDLVVLGFPAFSVKQTLAKHIAMGSQPVTINKGQIQFNGSLTVTA